MRERMYTLVQKAEPGDRLSKIYDYFIVIVAMVSVTPLMSKTETSFLQAVDLVTVYILFMDYVFRWMTCDFAPVVGGKKLKSPWNFIVYPFTPYALVTLLSLLPSLGVLDQGFRMLRLFRIFVVFHYSDNFRYIGRVFKNEKKTLLTVLYISLFYIFLSALAMFTYEPDTFETFFEALYWSTTALTTVGYGDVSPLSDVGRAISMVSSLFGIAVIAMPAGIVTAGFVEEINKEAKQREEMGLQPGVQPERAQNKAIHITPKVKRYAFVICVGVLMNFVMNWIAGRIGGPFWLDMTGTVWAALVLEPAAGLMVGLVDNMLLALFEYGVGSLLYFAVSAVVALLAGVAVHRNATGEKTISLRRVLLAVVLVLVVSTLVTGSIDLLLTRGTAPSTYWEDFYHQKALAAGFPSLLAFYTGHFVVKVFDTALMALLVAVFYRVTPRKIRSDD